VGSIRPRQGDRCLDRHFVTPRAMIAWRMSERSKERRPRIISATATRSTVNGAPGEIGSRNVRRSDLCWLALALSPSPLPHPRGAVPMTIRPACSNTRPSTTRQRAFVAVIGPPGKRKTRPARAPAVPVTITASGAIPGRNHADASPMSSLPIAPWRRDAQAARLSRCAHDGLLAFSACTALVANTRSGSNSAFLRRPRLGSKRRA